MKLVKSLHQKKYRDQTGLFLVEGVKLVGEAIHSDAKLEMIVYACDPEELPYTLPDHAMRINPKELERLSVLKTPNRVLATCRKLTEKSSEGHSGWIVALDRVSDPGNLGTILRICDWFGVQEVICDLETVDVYNPKVVQSSMGSIFRVAVRYLDLEEFLRETDRSVYLADMDGKPFYEMNFSAPGIIVMGSESHGSRDSIREFVNEVVSIPKTGFGESLNVAVSTGIILSYLSRPSSS